MEGVSQNVQNLRGRVLFIVRSFVFTHDWNFVSLLPQWAETSMSRDAKILTGNTYKPNHSLQKFKHIGKKSRNFTGCYIIYFFFFCLLARSQIIKEKVIILIVATSFKNLGYIQIFYSLVTPKCLKILNLLSPFW